MVDEERERKIQEAIKRAEAEGAWDAKYSQEDWEPEQPKPTTGKAPKARRVGKGIASKALKNLY